VGAGPKKQSTVCILLFFCAHIFCSFLVVLEAFCIFRGGFGPPKLSILLLAKCSCERVSSCALPA
jgi:hypothetical protein